METRKFDHTDWMAFSGCEGEPEIAFPDDYVVICDANGVYVVYPSPEDGDMVFATLRCDFSIALEIVGCWSKVPNRDALTAMGFHYHTEEAMPCTR